MREILFRGKRLYNGEWILGDYEHFYMENGNIVTYISEWGVATKEVDPETVGQYTGLKDKNDTKIFEGDIVVTRTDDIAIIQYDEEDAMFYLNEDNILTSFTFVSSKWCEVIGNIHDNPELMKGGADDE